MQNFYSLIGIPIAPPPLDLPTSPWCKEMIFFAKAC